MIDLWDINPNLISQINPVKLYISKALEDAELTEITSYYHQLDPHGVTGIVLLAKSHLSIHTWPEHQTAMVDFFGCGNEKKIEKVLESIITYFDCRNYKALTVPRGTTQC